MSNLNFEGMAIAEGVVETIVNIAIKDVEGVASLSAPSSSGILGLGKKNTAKGIEVRVNEDESISIATRVNVVYGTALPVIAQKIRESVADAVMTQIGIPVSSVDVYIDSIQFS